MTHWIYLGSWWGGLGLGLDWMTLEAFSNLDDPMDLFRVVMGWVGVGVGDPGSLFQP